ncbi:MAG: hypothetical protein COB17_04585 [Sulfurimonas sp.]|nr:MAG: hypothetical protein COB17_04585 [Sulfurimonas sp.]
MTKIKIIGALIFILSISLAVIFNIMSKYTNIQNDVISALNTQKSFTQEISKNIFYLYKNTEVSSKKLDISINKFLGNKNHKYQVQNKQIIILWNKFYLDVQKFRDYQAIKSLYSNILLEQLVKKIYNTNLKLLIEFNKLLKVQKTNLYNKINLYKYIQYSLFSLLVLLLLYIFTQLKSVINFVQKFILTSKSILLNSSIKDLEPIIINKNSIDISQASDNFNTLVQKINSSIKYSSNSIQHSYESIEVLEKNIEKLIELVYTMQNEQINKELTKKEDVVINSLEELNSSNIKLKNLKKSIEDLISY